MAKERNELSLREAWSKANHWRHHLMDFTMLTMALGALVATGGVTGLLDPVGIFLNMHIPAMSDLSAIWSGLEGMYSAAMEGSWISDMFWADAHELAHEPLVQGVNVDSLSLGAAAPAGWE